jgi:3-hydroxyisobutyrate dehydrogenase
MIAFFGAGLLGSGFVRAMLRHGESVNVWNRTFEKAQALEPHGAKAFSTPDAAVRGATRVHLSLSDDAAVDDVLERAAAGLGPGTLLVDHTTTSATATRERITRWESRGFTFVHAPVFMGPVNALESTGLMLVSGERSRVTQVRPHLDRMTGKVVDLGERPDAAAAFKLMGNLFLMFVTSGLAEFFALGRALEVEPRAAATLFESFNPGKTLDARVERMLSADWAHPSWNLAMARKDARLMLDEAGASGITLSVLPAIAERMDALIRQGHGGEDWTILAKDALEQR